MSDIIAYNAAMQQAHGGKPNRGREAKASPIGGIADAAKNDAMLIFPMPSNPVKIRCLAEVVTMIKVIKRVIVDFENPQSIIRAETKKGRLENEGYTLLKTELYFNNAILFYGVS